MIRFVRWQFVAIVATVIAVMTAAPSTLLAVPADQKGSSGPDIAAFQSAQFDLKGFIKVDGITVDVSGQGSLAPPDRSSGTYKIGPITVESITIGSNVYIRTRFDPQWEGQEAPSELPTSVGPIASSELLPKGPYVLQAQERVEGRLTTKWSSELDLSLLLALSELAPDADENVRNTLRSIKANLEVWVGNDDRQLYKERLVITFTVPAIEPQGDPLPGVVDMTVQYSKHNQPVNIQAPTQDRPRRASMGFPKLQTLFTDLYRAEPFVQSRS